MYYGYVKLFLIFPLLAICALASCGDADDVVLTEKVNTFLRANGWEEIKRGSKQYVSRELFFVLEKHEFGGGIGAPDETTLRKMQAAKLIVENELYDTAKKLFQQYPSYSDLVVFVALLIDAMPEKKPASAEFMSLFYEKFKDKKWDKTLQEGFPYLLLYEQAPEIFEKITAKKDGPYTQYLFNSMKTDTWVKGEQEAVSAVLQSSKEFKRAIIERLSIKNSIPLSIFKYILSTLKPSNVKKGAYLLVVDDTPHKLGWADKRNPEALKRKIQWGQYGLDSDHMTYSVHSRIIDRYSSGILKPAEHFNEAQIIIYESYSYEELNLIGLIEGYMVHTNVKVVDTTTRKTIFNETFETTPSLNYTVSSVRDPYDYLFDNKFNPRNYAEKISEIVEKGF